MKKADKKPFDFWILITVLMLLLLGTVMITSASTSFAYSTKGDTFFFLKKQLQSLPISIFAMVFLMYFDYKKLGKLSPVIFLASIVLLILVAIPGIGTQIKDARRWLYIGPINFQPSEFTKIAVILFFSYSLSKRKDTLKSFFKGLLPYLLILGFVLGLIIIEPHMSGTVVVALIVMTILFCAGAKISHFILLAVPAVIGLAGLVIIEPYRMARITSFIDPWAHKLDGGWQVIQSLMAIGSGGLFGRGLGRSLQKYLYIPEPHNDFIFAVMAEELGFIGVTVVIILFLIFIWRGIKVAMTAPDSFASLVAIGITSLVAYQFIINILVVTSSIPNTGMPLPFFSYGGTSMIFLMGGIGILLNISKYSNYERV
jgi:cell division protein FtsW